MPAIGELKFERGDKSISPQAALDCLAMLDVFYLMRFEITNTSPDDPVDTRGQMLCAPLDDATSIIERW